MPQSIPQQHASAQTLPKEETSTVWRANGRRVTDAESTIAAVIDLDHPRQGITLDAPGTRSDTLLGLDLRGDCQLTDHWLRGADVTAIYESAAPRQLRTTAMWRLHPSTAGSRAWELVVSAQTSLLQSDAVLAVVSEVDAFDTRWGTYRDGAVHWHANPSPEATCLLLTHRRSTGSAGTSLLVAAHPGDARRVTVTQDGPRTRIECWLFSNELEKGVLLRGRVLAAIGPAGDATAWAGDAAARFAASPPILTT